MAGLAYCPWSILRRRTPLQAFGIDQPGITRQPLRRFDFQASTRTVQYKIGCDTPDKVGEELADKQEPCNLVDMDIRVKQADADSERPNGSTSFESARYSSNVTVFPDTLRIADLKSAIPSVPINSNTFKSQTSRRTLSIKSKKMFATSSAASIQAVPDSSQHTPIVYEDVNSLRTYRREVTQCGQTIGFVPTMGALHDGHLDLMRAAAAKCSEVWVSIYVNPTQFGANEDLSTYPSTWDADVKKITKLNEQLSSKGHSLISTIFRPRSPEVLYPYGVDATSHVIMNPELTQILEGSSRPTFFRGVSTVVMKLLNIVQPDQAFFGQKDIQQFAVIKRMIKEFHMPVQIERVPTTRESSGLAMSSRNTYLGVRRLSAATVLYKMLSAAKKTFNLLPADQRTRDVLLDAAMKVYKAEKSLHEMKAVSSPSTAVQFRLDYLSLADPDTLHEIPDVVGSQGAIMSLAIYFEPLQKESMCSDEQLGINGDSTVVRLIDNELLGMEHDSE